METRSAGLFLYCDWCRCVMWHRRMNAYEAGCTSCRTFRAAPIPDLGEK